MTPRMWWTGIAVIALAILLHAAFPRYEWRTGNGPGRLIRIDRWTGNAQNGTVATGNWIPL